LLTQTQLTMVWGIGTQLPWWCAFRCNMPEHHASGCSVLGHGATGGSAPGHCASGCSCYSIYIPDKECQGINLLDTVLIFRTQRVKAGGIWTIPATVPHVQTQLSRYKMSRCSSQCTTHPNAAAVAYAFRTSCVMGITLRTQQVSYGCRVSRQFSSQLSMSRQMSGQRLP